MRNFWDETVKPKCWTASDHLVVNVETSRGIGLLRAKNKQKHLDLWSNGEGTGDPVGLFYDRNLAGALSLRSTTRDCFVHDRAALCLYSPGSGFNRTSALRSRPQTYTKREGRELGRVSRTERPGRVPLNIALRPQRSAHWQRAAGGTKLTADTNSLECSAIDVNDRARSNGALSPSGRPTSSNLLRNENVLAHRSHTWTKRSTTSRRLRTQPTTELCRLSGPLLRG